MKYLLDAGTLAAALRGRLPVALKLAELGPGDVAISVLSRMQVEIGLCSSSRAQARHSRLFMACAASINSITLGAYLQSGGESIGVMELMLAAQAMTNRYTLIAEDMRPYRMVTGLNVESWLSKPAKTVQ